MKLIFKENIAGSEDGIYVKNFVAGQVVEVAEKLAKIFIKLDAASVYNEEIHAEKKESPIKIEKHESEEEEEEEESEEESEEVEVKVKMKRGDK